MPPSPYKSPFPPHMEMIVKKLKAHQRGSGLVPRRTERRRELSSPLSAWVLDEAREGLALVAAENAPQFAGTIVDAFALPYWAVRILQNLDSGLDRGRD